MYNKTYRRQKTFSQLKYTIGSFFEENKGIFIFLSFSVVIGLFTGIFTAIRFNNGADIFFNDYSVINFIDGKLGTFSMFFSRMLSYEIVLIVVFVSSFSPFLIPLNFIVVLYRAYLLGLNSTIIILCYGLGGIFTTIFIIIPSQLCTLLLIIMFSSISAYKAICNKKYGCVKCDDVLVKLLIFTFLITIINVVETLFLVIFSSRVILVI